MMDQRPEGLTVKLRKPPILPTTFERYRRSTLFVFVRPNSALTDPLACSHGEKALKREKALLP